MSGRPTLTLEDLRDQVRAFVAARDWQRFHSGKNLSISIAIEAAELMECFQWQSDEEARESAVPDGALADTVDELADVLIYCLAMANALHVDDLGAAVLDKLERSGNKYPADVFWGRFK